MFLAKHFLQRPRRCVDTAHAADVLGYTSASAISSFVTLQAFFLASYMAHKMPGALVLAQENVGGKQGEAQLGVGDISNRDVHAQHRCHGDEADDLQSKPESLFGCL